MKSFKQFREDLQSVMSKDVGGIPLSFVAKRKAGVHRQAELQRQSEQPPKKPFVIGPGTVKTKDGGGLVNFPTSTSPTKLATPAEKPAASEPKPVTAPIKQAQGITPTVKKDGSIEKVKTLVNRETKAPKPPSINRQISTIVGNSKAASIRKSSAKPAQNNEPVATLPPVNVTATKEKDPNVGGGFVTAGVSKGPKGELRTVNVERGKSDTTALPHKNTGLDIPLQKPSNVPSAPAKSWQQTSTNKLPPQGSVARDVELAKQGFKKF